MIFALLMYALGRSQDILIFEIGSVIWLLIGLCLLQRGVAALKAQWFALFFMLFMVPLPGQFVDLVTLPMKMAVSYVAEVVLYAVGYPIGRNGVILQIGRYMLLVADACAGLHTLLTLEALGLLYLNLVRRDSLFRNVIAGHPDRADLVHRQRDPRDGAEPHHLPLRRRGRAGVSCTASPAWCCS